MSTPDQIVVVICPTLAASPVSADYISMASSLCDPGFFGSNWARAVALRAAHMFTLDRRLGGSGEAGAISSKSEGRLSVSFNSGGGDIGDLGQTSYGVQLRALIRIGRPGVSSGFPGATTVDSQLINEQGGRKQ